METLIHVESHLAERGTAEADMSGSIGVVIS